MINVWHDGREKHYYIPVNYKKEDKCKKHVTKDGIKVYVMPSYLPQSVYSAFKQLKNYNFQAFVNYTQCPLLFQLPKDICNLIAAKLDYTSFKILSMASILFYDKNAPISKKPICQEAAFDGHLRILKWHKQRNRNCHSDAICSIASLKDHFEVIDWAIDNGYSLNGREMCVNLAYKGHLEILKRIFPIIKERENSLFSNTKDTLKDSILFYGKDILKIAAANGHLNVLRWGLSEHFTWDEEVTLLAAMNGHLDILVWLKRKNHIITEKVSSEAALGGHLNILNWAKLNCPLDNNICSMAASKGHLDVLKWARENGFPWKETSLQAISKGHLTLLKWAVDNGSSLYGVIACRIAAEFNQLDILIWLRSKDSPWDQSIYIEPAAKGHLKILQWIKANGGPEDINKAVCNQAARHGHFEVLKWAKEEGFPFDAEYISKIAREENHEAILQWLKRL